MPSWKSVLLFLVVLIPGILLADETPVLQRTGKTFDPAIPTFASVTGFDFGQNITRHADMERYYNALVQAVPARIKLQKIGESYEGRALYYVLISSPENMLRLEELRQDNLKLSDPRKITADEANRIIENNPVFTALTYSVHGNEHSGVEAGMALAYTLLASTDAETKEILKNCVIIIDPDQNPDGRDRFINYFYQTKGLRPNADRNAAEHRELWPQMRLNHYLFDMNRDWTALTQQETRARIQAYRQYQPEIYIDLHEMGRDSSYFFPPPAAPQNPNVPKSLQDWWQILGKSVAADFDRNGIDYFTMERFDFWYPGYGDSWPTYNGAVSGTFEQASVRGLVVKKEDGTLLHYQDAIWHHFLSSLATCKMASAHRKEKLRDFFDFRASAIQEGKTGPVRAYILNRDADPLQTDSLVEKLLFQGIEVRQASADFKLNTTAISQDHPEIRSFHAGDYIIPLDQPLKRLIKVVFEKESSFDKKFMDEEARRKKENEPTEIYDITAWALPLAYGIEAYGSAEAPAVNAIEVQTPAVYKADVPESSLAYVANYTSNQVVTAILKLLQQDVRIYFSSKPFALQGKNYRAGSFIIKVKDNPKELHQILSDVSAKTGVVFDAASTGWTEEGPDFGSDSVFFIKKPKVAVLKNVPTEPTSYGAIQYLFDFEYPVDYTVIESSMLDDADLKDYSVIVIPDGGGTLGDYGQVLGPGTIDKLKNWIRNGGTLIAIQGGAAYLAENSDLTSVRRIKKYIKDSTEEAPEKEGSEKDQKKGDDRETESADFVPGSIADVKLYRKSFLTFGYGKDDVPVFVYSDNVFSLKPGEKAAVMYADADQLKIAGLFWDITKKRLAGKVYASEEELGEGHVILFSEDPNFRASWNGLSRLFMNGILFGPSL
jgi:hypothetical protein